MRQFSFHFGEIINPKVNMNFAYTHIQEFIFLTLTYTRFILTHTQLPYCTHMSV